MSVPPRVHVCCSLRGAGWTEVQVWSQKAASVWTLTEFDSVFSDTRLHLEEVY